MINRLHASNGEALFLVEVGDSSYQLTPYDPEFQKKLSAAEDLMSRYRNTLRVLAK